MWCITRLAPLRASTLWCSANAGEEQDVHQHRTGDGPGRRRLSEAHQVAVDKPDERRGEQHRAGPRDDEGEAPGWRHEPQLEV